MSLADQIIEHGPYDATVHPRYGARVYAFTGADLNELRDELIAARALKDGLGRITVNATSWDDADMELSCRCGWYANLGDDPMPLAELVQRAGEHTEACR